MRGVVRSVENDVGDGFGAYGVVDLADQAFAEECQLVFQGRRGDVDVEHAAFDIAAVGVAVDAGTYDFGP